jgi:osmotically-inducible protein OsmY
MKSDPQLQSDIEAELEWDPTIDAHGIKVAVKNGMVTLSGFVPSYPDKIGAEMAAKRVGGVKALRNDVDVSLPHPDIEPDDQIAQHAREILAAQLPLWADRIRVTVTDCRLTLEGDVEWHFQKEAIEAMVARTPGIEDVIDKIRIEPRTTSVRVKEEIELALRRTVTLEPGAVSVAAKAGVVILEGKTRSWNERAEVERIAWSAPGVWNVDNRLTVSGEAGREM